MIEEKERNICRRVQSAVTKGSRDTAERCQEERLSARYANLFLHTIFLCKISIFYHVKTYVFIIFADIFCFCPRDVHIFKVFLDLRNPSRSRFSSWPFKIL